MPIKEATGSIFDSRAQVLVNPVNCVGVMGKGLAKQFAMRYPEIIEPYKLDCDAGKICMGRVKLYDVPNGRYVVCFPTKWSWRSKSRLKDVDDGLCSLRAMVVRHGLESMAIPALGCGLGGLRWEDVQPMISENLGDLDCMIWVHPPL